jgi:hypothetical protein
MKFTQDYSEKVNVRLIVVAVQLPSGAIEVIQNTDDLENKYMYYLETYNKDMVMVKNPNIRILDWIIL